MNVRAALGSDAGLKGRRRNGIARATMETYISIGASVEFVLPTWSR